MKYLTSAVFVVCIFGLIACSTTRMDAAREVEQGMTADQVTSIMGDPAARFSRATYQALRYEHEYKRQFACGGGKLPDGDHL